MLFGISRMTSCGGMVNVFDGGVRSGVGGPLSPMGMFDSIYCL